jgi:hypothetical protein
MTLTTGVGCTGAAAASGFGTELRTKREDEKDLSVTVSVLLMARLGCAAGLEIACSVLDVRRPAEPKRKRL